MSEEKNKGGRPTVWDDKYLEESINFLSLGKSLTQLAKHLNIAKSTLYKWAEENQKFSDALQIGKDFSQAHWENRLEEMMFDKEVNSPLVKLYFANRFKWTDKQEVDNKSSDGSMATKPTNITLTAPKDD